MIIAKYTGEIVTERNLEGWIDFNLYFCRHDQLHGQSGVKYGANGNNYSAYMRDADVALGSHQKIGDNYYFTVLKNRHVTSSALVASLREMGFNFKCTYENVVYIDRDAAEEFIFLVKLTD